MSKHTIDKIKPNYLILKFGWSTQLVLPYAQGLALLETLEHAELYDTSGMKKIVPLTHEQQAVTVDLLSQADYAIYRTNALIDPES